MMICILLVLICACSWTSVNCCLFLPNMVKILSPPYTKFDNSLIPLVVY